MNQAGLDLVGLSSLDEARTKHITDFFMAEDLDFVNQSMLPTLMKEGSCRSDYRFRHFVTGQPIAVDYTLFLIKHSETNEPIGIATITRNIRHGRKQAEDAVRDRNVLLTSILESTPDIIVVKDREGRYVALNPSVANSFYGKPIEEILGKDDSQLLPPAAAVAIMAKDREIMEEGTTETYEEDVSTEKEKATTSFLTTKAPWRDAQGNILGMIAIARNISDRKQMEAELRDRNFFR